MVCHENVVPVIAVDIECRIDTANGIKPHHEFAGAQRRTKGHLRKLVEEKKGPSF